MNLIPDLIRYEVRRFLILSCVLLLMAGSRPRRVDVDRWIFSEWKKDLIFSRCGSWIWHSMRMWVGLSIAEQPWRQLGSAPSSILWANVFR